MKVPATILALLLAVLATVVCAEPPVLENDYGDDKLLAKATQEIAQMNSDQLNAFIEYISNCRAFDIPMSNRLHCRVALKRSEIKNSTADSVLRIARVLEWHGQALADADGRRKPHAPVQNKRHIDVPDGEVERFRDIFETFQIAAAARYSQLSTPMPK